MDIPLALAFFLFGVSGASFGYLIGKFAANIRFEKRSYKVRVPLLFKLLLPFARMLGPRIRKNKSFENWLEQADQRLIMAGIAQMYTPEEFVGLRLCVGAVLTFFGLLMFAVGTKFMIFMGLTFIVLGWLYPNTWLGGIIKKRHRAIQRALPSVLDLLTLSVEAGRDFLTALRDILRNRESDALGEELEQVFREVQLGKQRRHALQAMATRVRQSDLDSVVETLVQADQLGVSIGHILRVLGDQMRQKRFAFAEKQANESPVKLLFPLFIFIFPAVLIVMLGPILLRALQANAL